jgi:hypothetical protein
MVAHALSQSLSLTQSEHQEYIKRTPMIFKFLNPTKMGGITFRYAGVDWIQGDAVMADTGCDIMLITLRMAMGMKFPMVASNTKVHTSVSGQSGVLGEVANSFDVVLCKGTSDELVVRVGRGTNIKAMVAPDNNIYLVLHCQKFHHACGGYNDPVLNAFVFRPKLLSEGLLNPLVVLDGTVVLTRGNSWGPSSHVTIEEELHLHPTTGLLDVEDIIPNPSLLDDGNVEPHPEPIFLAQFGKQPSNQIAWLQWIRKHIPQRNGPDGWFKQYCMSCPIEGPDCSVSKPSFFFEFMDLLGSGSKIYRSKDL